MNLPTFVVLGESLCAYLQARAARMRLCERLARIAVGDARLRYVAEAEVLAMEIAEVQFAVFKAAAESEASLEQTAQAFHDAIFGGKRPDLSGKSPTHPEGGCA